MSHSQSARAVSSARARTRTTSSNTSFFVDIRSEVRSTSRLENCAQLTDMSIDMRTKSKQLLARNLQQTQVFFDKLKAFIEFLNLPNYSKEEVRQKRSLADRITRLMFEEEQRLRRGLQLSEMQKLDRILGPLGDGLSAKPRPSSAYAAPPGLSLPGPARPPVTSGSTECGEERPVPLRRERTFDLDAGSSMFQAEVAARKKQHRQSCPPCTSPRGWMAEAAQTTSEKQLTAPADPSLVEDFSLLSYFQEQRLEHTRLLRREVQRLEGLERLCLASVKQPKECWGARGKEEERKEERRKRKEEDKKKREEDKRKRKSSRKAKEKEGGLARKDTFTKTERRQAIAQLSLYREKEVPAQAKMTTSFREVADRKARQETSPVLTRSGTHSPLSWYIPSDPPSRAHSKLSLGSRQTSVEDGASTTPPPVTADRAEQTSEGPARPSLQPSGSRTYRPGPRHFGHQYPSRQASQGSPPPPCRNQGMQTGNSLLRMYLKKADKGNQAGERPQAFFLPLGEGEQPGAVIDLEGAGEQQAEETDLQRALRRRRPDYIAAAEERAGRLSRGASERAREAGEVSMARSTEGGSSRPQPVAMKRSQSTPRVGSILKPLLPPGTAAAPKGPAKARSGIPRKAAGGPTAGPEGKKSVTIAQPNGEDKPRHRAGAAVLRSRPRPGLASQQHYNIKNIYGNDSGKGIKAKAC